MPDNVLVQPPGRYCVETPVCGCGPQAQVSELLSGNILACNTNAPPKGSLPSHRALLQATALPSSCSQTDKSA